MESALKALGCVIVPGGVGNTELQLDAIAAIKPKRNRHKRRLRRASAFVRFNITPLQKDRLIEISS